MSRSDTSRSRSRKARVKLIHAPEANLLYLLSDGQVRALQLVPPLRVRPTASGQEACYFYNRLTDGSVRWISHDFAAEPELMSEDPEVIELLDLVSPDPPLCCTAPRRLSMPVEKCPGCAG